MSFLKGLTLAAVAAGLAGALSPAAVLAQSGQPSAGPPSAGQPSAARTKAPKPSPATEPGPTAVEMLNKSLNPGGSSDPDVPLPHPDLANVGPSGPARGTGTQLYGRQEEGGGVLGLRMPIPVDRGAGPQPTRSGSTPAAGSNSLQGR